MGFNQEKIAKLQEQTTNLWRVSRAWNGKSELEMTTGDAIYICTTNLKESIPKSAVHHYTGKLLNELIQGYGSPIPEATLIEFPDILDEAQEA